MAFHLLVQHEADVHVRYLLSDTLALQKLLFFGNGSFMQILNAMLPNGNLKLRQHSILTSSWSLIGMLYFCSLIDKDTSPIHHGFEVVACIV